MGRSTYVGIGLQRRSAGLPKWSGETIRSQPAIRFNRADACQLPWM
jgi:hypothetical protein